MAWRGFATAEEKEDEDGPMAPWRHHVTKRSRLSCTILSAKLRLFPTVPLMLLPWDFFHDFIAGPISINRVSRRITRVRNSARHEFTPSRSPAGTIRYVSSPSFANNLSQFREEHSTNRAPMQRRHPLPTPPLLPPHLSSPPSNTAPNGPSTSSRAGARPQTPPPTPKHPPTAPSAPISTTRNSVKRTLRSKKQQTTPPPALPPQTPPLTLPTSSLTKSKRISRRITQMLWRRDSHLSTRLVRILRWSRIRIQGVACDGSVRR